jgi:N-acetylglutamate synthase-like GNAT family acetyltransferase
MALWARPTAALRSRQDRFPSAPCSTKKPICEILDPPTNACASTAPGSGEATVIRNAEMKDVKRIADIITEAWKTAYDGLVDNDYAKNLPREKYIRIFAKNIAESAEIILVDDDGDGAVNGFVSAIHSSGAYDCEIVGLYVHPERQGSSVGSRLIHAMMARLAAEGGTRLLVWTLDGAKNNAFYKRMGGTKAEYKTLTIGGKPCRGVGFAFSLT